LRTAAIFAISLPILNLSLHKKKEKSQLKKDKRENYKIKRFNRRRDFGSILENIKED